MIRAFGENHAVLLSTHILPEVTLICRRVAIINQGRLLAIDSPTACRKLRNKPTACVWRSLRRQSRCARRCLPSTVYAAPSCTQCPDSDAVQTVECQVDAPGRRRGPHRACGGQPLGSAQAGTPATHPREHFSALRGRHGSREGRMNGMLAIYRKEVLTYFRSPIAYFVVSVFLLGTGYFFLYNIFLTGIGTMDETFQNMGIAAADPHPGDHDAPVLRRVQRTHHGAADDAAAHSPGRSCSASTSARRPFSC